MSMLLDPFAYGYMTSAMLVSALVGAVCAFLSCFLMLKGWSLIGDALSHSVVPGVAGLLGRWFWWSPVPVVRGVLSRTFTRRPSRPRRDLPLIAGTAPGREVLQGAAG